ncbi:MAG TPA: helix-turn-helix transcriptional regulator [Sphingomicrobium sp.]|jgi:transcriptional regulator with XRE-family HTH domain
MRLPKGFSCLRADLGQIIKGHRTGVIGVVGPISQHALASRVGITRVALSRIENGHTWPQGPTLDRIIAELELDWPDVAVSGDDGRRSRRFDDTSQGMQKYQLGELLRACRNDLGWSLAQVALRSGVSASQLSRIERGECGSSAVFTWREEDLHHMTEDRRIVFANPVLADLAAGRLNDASDA